MILVDSEAKLLEMVANIKREKECAVDTETTGLHLIRDRVIVIPVTVGTTDYVIPLRLVTQRNMDSKVVAKHLSKVLADKRIKKYFHNFKYDFQLLYNDGMTCIRNIEDSMVAGWLLDENRPKGLKERCKDIDLFLSPFEFTRYFTLRKQYLSMMEHKEVKDPGRAPLRKDFPDASGFQLAKAEWRRKKDEYAQ